MARVADTLAHSRPLPLIIDYVDKRQDITAEDEQCIILALQHRDRVRRIRVLIPVPNLQKLIAAKDKAFPALGYLRHLIPINFAFPIGCHMLTTAADLVTLSLRLIHPSAYFSSITCSNAFHPPLTKQDIERQLSHTPIMTHVTLPGGASSPN